MGAQSCRVWLAEALVVRGMNRVARCGKVHHARHARIASRVRGVKYLTTQFRGQAKRRECLPGRFRETVGGVPCVRRAKGFTA